MRVKSLTGRLAGTALALTPVAADGTAAKELPAIVTYIIVNGREIPHSLTGAAGDATRGRELFLRFSTGCAACHSAPGIGSGGFGEEAVPLDGVGARLTEGEVRLWIVDPRAISPGSRMPGFYRAGQRQEPEDSLYNGPRLTAAEIEDLVAWLATLTGE